MLQEEQREGFLEMSILIVQTASTSLFSQPRQ
jgi:hypothetical protein